MDSTQELFQLRVLGFSLLQDGDVGVGAFPEGEEIRRRGPFFLSGIWSALLGTNERECDFGRHGYGETAPAFPTSNYAVLGATPQQEALVRSQIQTMQPAILPLRAVFVPHWKYVDNTRIFHLHVPTGYASAMFTHLPNRTIFIDTDRYNNESIGYWVAHELGHLATNRAKEEDAEKAAHELRRRLKDERKGGSH